MPLSLCQLPQETQASQAIPDFQDLSDVSDSSPLPFTQPRQGSLPSPCCVFRALGAIPVLIGQILNPCSPQCLACGRTRRYLLDE